MLKKLSHKSKKNILAMLTTIDNQQHLVNL